MLVNDLHLPLKGKFGKKQDLGFKQTGWLVFLMLIAKIRWMYSTPTNFCSCVICWEELRARAAKLL
jgi:hypothetical protein